MFLILAHTLAYTLVQTFGFTLFSLALQRLGKLRGLHRGRAFFYLLLVNGAGTLTFGEAAWQKTSTPVAALLFLLGMAFFIAAHLYLALRRLAASKSSHSFEEKKEKR